MNNHDLYTCIGRLHQEDSDAIAIKFDTEFRDEDPSVYNHRKDQIPEAVALEYQIDPKRYVLYQGNTPGHLHDRILAIADLITKGARVKLIAVDSCPPFMGEFNVREFITNLSGNVSN